MGKKSDEHNSLQRIGQDLSRNHKVLLQLDSELHLESSKR